VADLRELLPDLAAECQSLDEIVSALEESSWDLPTPAEPWSVRDQISHLAFFDEQARLAAGDPEGFVAALQAFTGDVEEFMTAPLQRGRQLTSNEVLGWWREARRTLFEALTGVDPATRIPWFGPAMSPASFITARLMETWAHGQDVCDAIGVERGATHRLKHVAHLGVRARPYSYQARGLPVPDEDVSVELVGPAGELWVWGERAEHRVAGPALDFCLVVTQRRHVADTDLVLDGARAVEWMEIAQAFAGPPGPGRKPGQFARR
jgi:uncharacterized protein (TIGR03084 family)